MKSSFTRRGAMTDVQTNTRTPTPSHIMKRITGKYGWSREQEKNEEGMKLRESRAERPVSHYRPRLGHQRQANVRRPLPDCLEAHVSVHACVRACIGRCENPHEAITISSRSPSITVETGGFYCMWMRPNTHAGLWLLDGSTCWTARCYHSRNLIKEDWKNCECINFRWKLF